MSSAPGARAEIARVIAAFCNERYDACGARTFGFTHERLVGFVEDAASKWNQNSSSDELEKFLSSFRLDELVLTRACAAGINEAWDRFLSRYRAVLYNAAYKIAGDDATARELADSLYAELYGISDTGRQRQSKLLYYSGRGSLEGWLRTVVAQEYVNRYRRTRRETSLDEAVEEGRQFPAPPASTQPTPDHRLDDAIAVEIAALDSDERFLLVSYYLDGRKLAEIARLQRVHESTISRKLERATASLRKRIRKRLMESGMGSRETDELLAEFDVRDIQVPIEKTLRQEPRGPAFYKGSEP